MALLCIGSGNTLLLLCCPGVNFLKMKRLYTAMLNTAVALMIRVQMFFYTVLEVQRNQRWWYKSREVATLRVEKGTALS